MDGAALYDIRDKQYIETIFLPDDICMKAEEIIAEQGLNSIPNLV